MNLLLHLKFQACRVLRMRERAQSPGGDIPWSPGEEQAPDAREISEPPFSMLSGTGGAWLPRHLPPGGMGWGGNRPLSHTPAGAQSRASCGDGSWLLSLKSPHEAK